MYKVWIGFSKNHKIGSYLIRCYLDSNFSHTFFRFKDDSFEDSMVFHAVGKGLTFISETNFLKENVRVDEFKLDISEELYIELRNACNKHAGLHYGYLQNIGLVLMKIFCLNNNPLNDGINCSEWVAYCLEEIFPEDWDSSKMDFNNVSPTDIHDYLSNKESLGEI